MHKQLKKQEHERRIIQNRISKDADEDGWFVSPARERAKKKQQRAVPVTDIKADQACPSPQDVMKVEQSPLPLGVEAASVEDLSQKIQQLQEKKHDKETLSKILKDLQSTLDTTPTLADTLVAKGIVPALLCQFNPDAHYRHPEISASALRLLEMIRNQTSSATSSYKLILEGETLHNIIDLMAEYPENSTIVEFGLKITNALIFAHRKGRLGQYNASKNASLERNDYVHYGYTCTRCKVSPIIGTRYKNKGYDNKIDIDACESCFRSHYRPKFQEDMRFREIRGEFVSGLEKFTKNALWKQLSDAIGNCDAGILHLFDLWDEHRLEIQHQLVILAIYILNSDSEDVLGIRDKLKDVLMPRLDEVNNSGNVKRGSPFYSRAMHLRSKIMKRR